MRETLESGAVTTTTQSTFRSTAATIISESFSEAIHAVTGITPNLIPGEVVRFERKKRYWAWLSEDCQAGVFGDHKTGLKQNWFADRDDSCSAASIAESRAKAEKARLQRKAERHRLQQQAARQCNAIWNRSAKLENHGYCTRKQIGTEAFRLHADGRLITHLRDIQGQLQNLQYIAEDGEKRFHYGGRITGCFCIVAKPDDWQTIIIAEGVATACTLSEIEQTAVVIAAMNAGNLKPVAEAVRSKYPQNRIIIAGDDDRHTDGNPGKQKAIEAARTVGGEYVLPEFPEGAQGTDFNDLLLLERGISTCS